MAANSIESILFDLDGTLLDTHKDLCAALNQVLQNHNKATLPIAVLRPFVSKGAMTMVCLAFRCSPQSDTAKQLWTEMLEAYWDNIAVYTCFFSGMEDIINEIEASGRPWGIVTNKPGHLTDKLLQTLELDKRAMGVVSGDTLKVKKPNPEPLWLACETMQSNPNRCIYIGDDERDIVAGKAAGMQTLAAAYGYISPEENIESWNADGIIKIPADTTHWIN